MKLKIIVLIVAALICSNYAFALGEHGYGECAEAVEAAVKVNNEACPVSGENVEAMGGGIEYEYDGKIYSFCCSGCIDIFEKNPEKYGEIAEESVEEEHEVSDHPH
ncbi:MAG: YHS domain-containing protein [Candidatus Omnitrophica bacterium]|nr:YHS domain-containing protein [Candidatus Omnitrophota bacterium]